MKPRILCLLASARAESSNAAVMRVARAGAQANAEIEDAIAVESLPPLIPGLEAGCEPETVMQFRASIAAADGVLIVTPEYGHSLPGSLKNALDWLIESGELANKPVAAISASPTPSGGLRGLTALVQTLLAQSASVVALLPIAAARSKIDSSGTVERLTSRRIAETMQALIETAAERPQ